MYLRFRTVGFESDRCCLRPLGAYAGLTLPRTPSSEGASVGTR